MDYHQKARAMTALCGQMNYGVSIGIDSGIWVASASDSRRSITKGTGSNLFANGRGETPEEAINDDWRQHVEELKSDEYIQIGDGDVAYWRWNGFMWQRQDPAWLHL